MGSWGGGEGGLITVDEPSGVEVDPDSGISVKSAFEQKGYGLNNDNVRSSEVYLCDVDGSLGEQEKSGVLRTEKMLCQNEGPFAVGLAVGGAGGVDSFNTSEGCCLEGGSRLVVSGFGSSLDCSEVAQGVLRLSGSARETVRQDEENDNFLNDKVTDNFVSGNGMEAVVESKSGSETIACNLISHSMPSVIAEESSLQSGCPSPSAQKNQQKDAETTVFSLGKAVMDGKSEDSTDAEACLPVPRSQSRSCHLSFENSDVTDLLGNCLQKNEQSFDKTKGPSEGVIEFLEEKGNTIDDTRAEFCLQSSILAGSACNPNEDLLGISPDRVNGKLDIADHAPSDFAGELNSSSILESSKKSKNTEEGINRVDGVSALKCPGALSLDSRRSSRASKSIQRNQTRRRGTRKGTKSSVLHQNGILDTIFKISRRKRSCLSKLTCSSIWGSMNYINKIFENGSEASALQEKNRELPIAKGRLISKSCSENGAGGSKKGSRQKSQASSAPIRLRVKFRNEMGRKGLNTVVPDVADASYPSTTLHDHGNHASLEGNVEFLKLDGQVAEKTGDTKTEKQVQLLEKSTISISDVENLDTHLANKNLDVTFGLGSSAEDIGGTHLETRSNLVSDGPGTSPDSEVINVNLEVQENARYQEDSNRVVITSTEEFASPREVISNIRGKPIGKKSCVGSSSTVHKVNNRAKSSKKSGKVKPSNNSRSKQKDGANSSTCKNTSSMLSNSKKISAEQFSFVRDAGSEVSGDACTNKCVEDKADLTIDVKTGLSQTQSCLDLHHSEKVHKLCDKLKYDIENKCRTKAPNAGRSRTGTGSTQKKNLHRVAGICKREEMVAGKEVVREPHFQQETEHAEKIIIVENNVHVPASMEDVVPDGALDQCQPPISAWVSCDDCHKWRRIPPSLLDSIQDLRWVCGDNMDQSFASCSIPQEKSNAEINAELGYADPLCEEDACNDHIKHKEAGHKVRNDPMKEYKIMRTNDFLHRGRKTLTIDEVMVCNCKPPQDGNLGCGDGCFNRIVNLECVKGTCPCGDRCSNQQFQRRQWAKLGLLRCGKKGYGLKSLQDISEGQFIIEYVGEVLNMHAYEARQKAYAQEGHKHFYFMTLDAKEVIDACKKGNVGRFINHSCEPNCRTEKWIVNGEICIGLFALKDIKKDEELTFDYNYVRVFGAAVKKCYCGSSRCQGYIGGDPLESEMVARDDSDEECSEEHTDIAASLVSPLQGSRDVEDSIGELVSSQQTHLSVQPNEAAIKIPSPFGQETPVEEARTSDAPCHTEVLDISPIMKQQTDMKFVPNTLEEKHTSLSSRPRVKTSLTSVKMDKCNIITSGNKVQALSSKQSIPTAKPKKSVEGSACGRFEAVEVKLNLLLDVSGGIKKDAVKGYLKLMLLTAASGDSNRDESIQSNRDLSMILDALLKTKSRTVLTDIINKNGLRMLHNIIKQYRKDFLRIPILRKLMKVLEYLSVKGVLTLEHISSGPPCPGMESFRESMLSLTEHVDKQIHQIARNFRDRWIPRPLRIIGCVDKDDSRGDFNRSLNCNRFPAPQGHWHGHGVRQSETIDCVKQSDLATPQVHSVFQESSPVPCTGGSTASGLKSCKRKSRWDQPEGSFFCSQNHDKEQLNDYTVLLQNSLPHQDEAIRLDGKLKSEDVPPGFSSPIAHNRLSSSKLPRVNDITQSDVCHQGRSMEATIGHPQAKFVSRSPVSYGIPISVLEQLGTPQNGSVDDWLIAPGMPFSPFPPLPPVPRDKNDRLPTSVVNPLITDCMAAQQDNHVPAFSRENIPSTSGTYQPYIDGPKSQYTHKRSRGNSGDLGRRYIKQQKGPNTRFGPPWVWNKNGWGFMGNNLRNGSFCSTTTNGQSPFCSEDEECRDERGGSNFYQHYQHQNRY